MASGLFVFSHDRLVLALLAAAVTVSAGTAAMGYFETAAERRRFCRWAIAFLLSVLGCLFSSTWLGYLVFMELSTFALFVLVAAKESRTAFRYLTVQLAGAAFLVVGIAGAGGGSLPLGPVPQAWRPFFLLALGVKAALPGLHFWLPGTHGTAPAPVSALLSGVSVKAGLLGILYVPGGDPMPFLVVAGTLMALWGSVQAVLQSDMKRLLAYSTISQLGYMVAASGAGAAGALCHAAAHGLFKGALFLCAGIIEKNFGTRDLRRLGGGVSLLPLTFVLFLVSAASAAALPGTAGYAGKAVVKQALEAMPLVSLCLLAANAGSVMSVCRMGWCVFRRSPGSTPLSVKTGTGLMNLGVVILSVSSVVFGSFPGVLPGYLGVPAPVFYPAGKIIESLLVCAVGAAAFFILRKRLEGWDLPDMDRLTDRVPGIMTRSLSIFGRLQGGFLREYIMAAASAAIILAILLSRAG